MKRLLQIVLIIFLIFATVSLSKSVLSSYQKLTGLNSAQAEIKKLQAENQQLQEEAAFRKTDFYIEKSAREKLGLGKGDETVYLVHNLATESAQAGANANLPNWQKWWNLFFN